MSETSELTKPTRAPIESSSEFQEIVLSSIIKDNYLFTHISRYIDETVFDQYAYKIIYKAVLYYYTKYSKLPSFQELVVTLQELVNPSIMSFPEVKKVLNELYNSEPYEEKFVIDKVTTFIKRSKTEKVLKDLLPRIQNGESIAIDNLGEELSKANQVDISTSTSFRLDEIDKLPEIRKTAVGTDDNPIIIKSFVDGINKSLLFKGYKPADLVMIVAAPGTGKTMFMINEGANAAMQGFNVLHLFIGDMKEYDGFIRYTSYYTRTKQEDLINMGTEEQARLIQSRNMQRYFSSIVVSSYAAGSKSVEEIEQEVYRLQAEYRMHFDMILVDYADNLQAANDMMYKSGGHIYNRLSLLGYKNNSVIIVGSQPKVSYWGDEILPQESAAESSQKQHVIDVMITMGLTNKGSKIGSLYLPKVRRGTKGTIIRMRTEYEVARINEINEQDYLSMKAKGE